VWEIVVPGPRLGRSRERAETDPVVATPAAAPAAHRDRPAGASMLILVRKGDAVSRAHLSRQLDRQDVSTIRATPFGGLIALVVPAARIAGIEVREDALSERGAAKVADRAKEP